MVADIVVIGILAVSVIAGVKKGFVRSFFSLFSAILSLVLAFLLYPGISGLLANSAIPGFVSSNVEQVMGIKPPERFDDAPVITYDNDAVQGLNLPDVIGQKVAEGADVMKISLTDSLANGLSRLAVNLISIAVVFLIVRLGMFLLSHLLDGLVNLPVIGGINRLAGGLFGGVSGLLVICILLTLLTFVAATSSENQLVEAVRESTFTSLLYDYNPIVKYVIK